MINIRIMTSFLILFVSLSNITFSQTDKQLNEVVSTLKQKVLLSDEQEKQVINILTDLKNNISVKPDNKDSLVKAAQTKVESLLDKKQKMKYDILKKELWQKISG